jgi:hypothetical protein
MMLPTLHPGKLVEVIERRAKDSSEPIIAFWYSLTGPREEYAQAVRDTNQQIPIAPLIPRRPGMFEAPNALVSDLVQLIDESRSEFEGLKDKGWPIEQPIVFLILSRTPLSIAGGCSPTPLPAWFPRLGGSIVTLEIQDLTFSADGPLNCSEAAIPVLCEALFTLEVALVTRLKARLTEDPNSCYDFFHRVAPSEIPIDLTSSWEKNACNVKEAGAFRPSVKDGASVVARLVRLFGKTTPDQISNVGESIAKALQCELAEEASLISVLFRPTQRNPSAYATFGRNLLVMVYSGYQYVTAAAHADGYPNFPISLIHATSNHLSHTICCLAETISSSES